MKLIIPKELIIIVFILRSFVSFSQANPALFLSYGSPSVNIVNAGNVDYGQSTEIEYSIINIPNQGNPTLEIQNITLSNSNFVISSGLSSSNIKKGEVGKFKIRKNNFACSSSPQSTVVTIYSNASNYATFSFVITYTNAPVISVLGGSPTQPISNGQTAPISINGTRFGTIDVLTSVTRTYTISNTGTCPLTLGALTSLTYNPQTGLPSPDFSIVSLSTSTIEPGSTASLVIRFTPQSTGTKSAIITIPSNDGTKNPYTFVVNGEGYNPNVVGPGGINADFRLWLKANRGMNLGTGNKVPLWKDLGSHGKDASQSDITKQPTFINSASGNINYNPVVKFENNGNTLNQFLYNTENGYYTQETFIVMESDATNGAAMTIISGTSEPKPATEGAPYPIVPNENSGIGLGDFTSRLSNEKLWFNQWQTTTGNYFTVADASGSYTKAGIINTRNKTTTASNGVDLLFNSIDSGNQTSINTTYTNLGYNDAGLWKGTPYNLGKNVNGGTFGNLNGRIAEIISFAARVPDSDRPKIETYLAIKYGITLGVNGTSKNYINSVGAIIWNATSNVGYNYNIAGIGNDVGSDLNQKQSKSSNETNVVTIGLGEISATNSANINEFPIDKNFLIWGSDNGTYTAGSSNSSTIAAGLTTNTIRINKKWKIVETGGDVGNVIVGIPATAFSSFSKLANEEYTLIVSDDASFGDANIVDIVPLKSDGQGNLQTWYDFDGTKYFTFGKSTKVEGKYQVKISATDPDFLVGEYNLNLNSGSFTIGCWIRNDGSSATNKTIIGKGVNFGIQLNAANKIEVFWDGLTQFTSNTIIADNKWHNIVAVYYEGSADLYIDGILDTSTFNLTNPTPNFSRFSVGALYINKNSIIAPFRGEIDQIHIWDKALVAKQVNYLMNQEIVKYSPDNTVDGAILPYSVIKNEVNSIAWNRLKTYYDFNSFYGTTVEGLTDDRNFLRIKYLNKNKQIVGTQTAPLPYETIADGIWSDSAIWKNGSIQKIPNDISIVNKTTKPIVNGCIVNINHNIESTGNMTLLGLTVLGTDSSNYKTLKVSNDSKIEISHYLKLDGVIDLTGRSQLIQTLNSELDVNSMGYIKRTQQGSVNKYNYNYWSSPVGPTNSVAINNNLTVNTVFKSGTTTNPQNINWVNGLNGSQSSSISLARYWLYKFENGSEYSNWIHFNETDPIKPSQGFTLKGVGSVDATNSIAQNYTFIGKPFNGLINCNSVLPDNLFLVGNPYPSALDAYKFIYDNISVAHGGTNAVDVIDGTLYFWQHSPTNASHVLSEYSGGYAALTLVGGTPPIAPSQISGIGTSTKNPYQFIPVGQGFFVNGAVTSSGNKAILFNNNQRLFIKENDVDDVSHPVSNTLFKTKSNTAKTTTISRFNDNSNDVIYNNFETKIRLGFTANDFHRQLLIGFMISGATDGLDVGYDGYQIETQENDSYFIINNLEYSIQGVGVFDVSKSYPLGVKSNVSGGDVKFMVDETERLNEEVRILIHDKEADVFYDITEHEANVTLEKGTYNSRFEMTFKNKETLAIKTNELPESMVLIYNNEAQNNLKIIQNSNCTIKDVTIYTILGQSLIKTEKKSNSNSIEIPFNVQRGTYIVKVTTDKGTITKKILKK
ncbi:LamG-like jellyroll fold domain-containing protein [Flavobacterium cellulosilyticum]|nr:LamG-like jellyroll fold domain-containing protein [Flavobacterium cellulosilyticum]